MFTYSVECYVICLIAEDNCLVQFAYADFSILNKPCTSNPGYQQIYLYNFEHVIHKGIDISSFLYDFTSPDAGHAFSQFAFHAVWKCWSAAHQEGRTPLNSILQ